MTTVDRSRHLREAAQARHAASLKRAEDALRTLLRQGQPISMKGFAKIAGVSRSWLYNQPEVRAQLEQLQRAPARTAGPRRDAQRATSESLRQQIHTCRQEITRLRAENHQLRDQLARRLGDDRVAAITKQPF